MNLRKFHFVLILSAVSFLDLVAQSTMTFENVLRETRVSRPLSDSNYTYNFEYLSSTQLDNLRWSLLKIKCIYCADFALFRDMEEYMPMELTATRDILYLREDSMDVEMYDANGNTYTSRVPGMVDSTWYFENLTGFEFNEDWIIDTIKFSCEIKNKTYAPMVLKRGKEEWGPVSCFYIKPLTAPSNARPITDFIITDVYSKHGYFTENQYSIKDANTQLDAYKTMLLINGTIDKIKAGKLKCYHTTIPFTRAFDKKELKTLFTDEFSSNKHEKFPVRYKMYNYRFKLVEKWVFDPFALAFKKEALGIILMKRNEVQDLTINADGWLNYTFTPVAYVPFNQK